MTKIQKIFNNSKFYVEHLEQYTSNYKVRFKKLSNKEIQEKINEFLFNQIYNMLLLTHRGVVCHEIGFNFFFSTNYGNTSIGVIVREAAKDGNLYIDNTKFYINETESDLFFIYNKNKEFSNKLPEFYYNDDDTELYLLKYNSVSSQTKSIIHCYNGKHNLTKKLLKAKLVGEYLPYHTSLNIGKDLDEEFWGHYHYDKDIDLNVIPFPEATSINCPIYDPLTGGVLKHIYITLNIKENSTYLDLWKAIDEIYIIQDLPDHNFIEDISYNKEGLLIVDFGS